MSGLDAVIIGALVEDLLAGRDTMNDDLFEALNGVMIEIDYLFKEETDKLNQLHEIMGNYKK